MVSSSKKKNKKKDRKTKKDEADAKKRATAHKRWKKDCTNNVFCDHGFTVTMPDGHPVSSFMDTFYVNWLHKRNLNVNNEMDVYQKHPDVWDNSSYREMAINILVCIGTNLLLNVDEFMVIQACHIAQVIVLLEYYDGTRDIDDTASIRAVATRRRDVNYGSKRDILKFYSKRTSCNCLKEIHQKVRKSTQKTGICYGCGKDKKRASLSVCSRCMITQYCSRECQVDHWLKHEEVCDRYVRVREEMLLFDKEVCDRYVRVREEMDDGVKE